MPFLRIKNFQSPANFERQVDNFTGYDLAKERAFRNCPPRLELIGFGSAPGTSIFFTDQISAPVSRICVGQRQLFFVVLCKGERAIPQW